MKRLTVTAFILLLEGCFHTRHYVEDATRMDGLFFGDPGSQAEERCDESRAYAVFGFFAWRQEDVESPGRRLADLRRRGEVPTGARVETFSKFDVLDVVLSGLVGLSWRVLFAPRSAGIVFGPGTSSESASVSHP